MPSGVNSFGSGWYRHMNLSPRNIFCLFICSIVMYITLVLALLKGNVVWIEVYYSYKVESCLQDEDEDGGYNNLAFLTGNLP